MNSEPIVIPRGDSDSFYFYLADITTGTPVITNVTDYTLICSVKTQYDLPDENVVMTQKVSVLSATAGTGTVSSSSTTVTGSGSSFTTQVQSGDLIISGTQVRIVDVVTSDTVLTTKGLPSPDDLAVTINDSFSPALSSASFSIVRPQVSFTKTDTDISFGDYVYDVKWLDDDGENPLTTNVGKFTISKNVSRKNS